LYNNVQHIGGEILILYTKDNCPRCEVLKTKLNAKNVEFEEISDIDVMVAKGITFAPMLEVNGELLDLSKANDFINSL
jgi:glutaredoxin